MLEPYGYLFERLVDAASAAHTDVVAIITSTGKDRVSKPVFGDELKAIHQLYQEFRLLERNLKDGLVGEQRAATDKPNLTPPRRISTLPFFCLSRHRFSSRLNDRSR